MYQESKRKYLQNLRRTRTVFHLIFSIFNLDFSLKFFTKYCGKYIPLNITHNNIIIDTGSLENLLTFHRTNSPQKHFQLRLELNFLLCISISKTTIYLMWRYFGVWDRHIIGWLYKAFLYTLTHCMYIYLHLADSMLCSNSWCVITDRRRSFKHINLNWKYKKASRKKKWIKNLPWVSKCYDMEFPFRHPSKSISQLKRRIIFSLGVYPI